MNLDCYRICCWHGIDLIDLCKSLATYLLQSDNDLVEFRLVTVLIAKSYVLRSKFQGRNKEIIHSKTTPDYRITASREIRAVFMQAACWHYSLNFPQHIWGHSQQLSLQRQSSFSFQNLCHNVELTCYSEYVSWVWLNRLHTSNPQLLVQLLPYYVPVNTHFISELLCISCRFHSWTPPNKYLLPNNGTLPPFHSHLNLSGFCYLFPDPCFHPYWLLSIGDLFISFWNIDVLRTEMVYILVQDRPQQIIWDIT